MISGKLSNVFKGAMLIFCAVVLSLSASSVTRAKSRINAPAKVSTMKGNPNEVRRTLLQIINRKGRLNPKVAKSLSAACGCAAAQDQGGFGSFKSCLWSCIQNSGMSAITLATCGAICSSGNLVGCAICAGTQEWIVMYCGQVCAWRRVFNTTEGSMRPSKNRRLPQTNPLPQRAASAT